MSEVAIDPDELKRYSFSVWSYKQGEMVSLMIHIGDRLGLYRALDGAGPMSAEQLALTTGLQERWLLEWLRGQAAARLLNYHDGDLFELTPVGAAVLADETSSLSFAAGAFSGQTPPETVDKLIQALRRALAFRMRSSARMLHTVPSACWVPGRGRNWYLTLFPRLKAL